jgi:hypothetical protein
MELKLLYISNTSRTKRAYLDPSVRYRCFNFAEEFMRSGYIVDVISFAELELSMLENYNVFVFHRPAYDKKLFDSLEILKENGSLLFADYDDLIFNDKYALISPIFKQGRVTKEKCLDIFERNKKALKLFENILVSTNFLALKVKEAHETASVHVLPNALSSDLLKQLELNKYKYVKQFNNKKTITYLSGTESHNKDFEVIENVLVEILEKYSDRVSLIIVGPLKFTKSKFKQVKHKRYVEYDKLFEFISKTDINVAPLELNDFTNCKSGLKFFESGILGVPSIVSPIEDMLRFKDSKSIIYATSDSEWYSALEKMICDDDFYRSCSDNAYRYTKENCVMKISYKKFQNIIEGLL